MGATEGKNKKSKVVSGLKALLVGLFVLAQAVFLFSALKANAVTYTWDGGGSDNNWSTCANWSTDTCPTSTDVVVFDGTSTKNATVDASFQGTVAGLAINSGYTGTVTLARDLTDSSIFTLAAGTIANGSQTLHVGGNLNITGGTYAAGTGTLDLNGTANNLTFGCNNVTFNLVTLNLSGGGNQINSDCTFPLGNNPSPSLGSTCCANTVTLLGVLTGSGIFTTDVGNFVISGASPVNHITGFTNMQFIGGNFGGGFHLSGGATFNAPATMRVAGNFTIDSGTTFNAGSGSIDFNGNFDNTTLTCNNTVFNTVTFHLGGGANVISSDCTFPLGNNPSPSFGSTCCGNSFTLLGVLTGSGTLTTDVGKFIISGASPVNHIIGFTSMQFIGGGFGGGFKLTGGASFNAPATMRVAGNFTIDSGTSFNAGSGSIDFNGNFDNTTFSCNNTVFNAVTFHLGGGANVINSNCTFPLGNNPSPSLGSTCCGNSFTLLGVLTGSGTLTADVGKFIISGVSPVNHITGFTDMQFLGVGFGGGFRLSSGASFNAPATMSVVGDYTLDAGTTFNAGSGTLHVAGAFVINSGATFNAQTGTLDFNGGTNALPVQCNNTVFHLVAFHRTAGDWHVPADCTFPLGNNPTISSGQGGCFLVQGALTGTGTLTKVLGYNSSLCLDGNSPANHVSGFSSIVLGNGLSLSNGATFTAPAGDLSIAGDLSRDNASSFSANGGTVILSGGYNETQTITGSFTFNNLVKSNTYGYNNGTIVFEAGKTQTVLGSLELTGIDPGNPLNLVSSSAGNQWNIDPQGSRSVSYVAVADSDNVNSTAITASSSIDSGNNTNWDIQAPPLQITTTSLDNGRLGTSYSNTIQTQYGGTPTFSVVSGNLPTGLSLDSTTGEISGTPTVVGLFNFTIQATDGTSSPTQALSITVSDPTKAYRANDLLGQIDGNGNPIWNQNGSYNSTGTPDANGMAYPQGSVLDNVHHRLFVSTCGQRVLVYNLDTNNNLIDRMADYVLGQPDLNTDDYPNTTTAATNGCPVGASYDPVHDRLFSVDNSASRVLVFDLSNGIVNGMDASYVLGQPDFTSSGNNVAQDGMSYPYGGSAYDPTTDYFYVSDSNNARVLVYDLSNGVTNGMDASYVIGQPDFTSSDCAVTASGLSYPYGLVLDTQHHRLFVADDSSCFDGTDYINAARVLVYDLANLHTGMDASYVIGQPDFTTGGRVTDMTHVNAPEGLAYDPSDQRLFVSDDWANRVMVFDVSHISNGQPAIAVIGQPDFNSDDYSCDPTQYSLCDSEGLSDAFDTGNNRLYISDSSNNRIMIYEFVTLDTASVVHGTTGTHYSQALSASRYQGTLNWTVTSGALPAGLSLNAATGAITGIPTAAGTYSFTIQARDDLGDAGGFTDSRAYTLTVAQGATPPLKPTVVRNDVNSSSDVASADTGVATNDAETPTTNFHEVTPDSTGTVGTVPYWLTNIALLLGGFGTLLGALVWFILRRRRKQESVKPQ